MKTIEIDDDIYEHLLQNVQDLGEDASSILRRLLDLNVATEQEGPKSEIDECLQDPMFRSSRKAIDRFLTALSWLYKQHQDEFNMVTTIRGTRRVYFADNEREINRSGDSAFPRKIPNTPYWVVTNNDTPKKQRILKDVMLLLGYSNMDSDKLSKALRA